MHPRLSPIAMVRAACIVAFVAVCHFWLVGSARGDDKPRLVVLTDIGGDPDDQQSLIRLMLYANEFDIEGLIASASGTPGELKQAVVRADLIREIVNAYGKIRENLLLHAPGYPTAESFLQVVKSGNEKRGLEAVGEGHDTEASRWIISAADRVDARPLNIASWDKEKGGPERFNVPDGGLPFEGFRWRSTKDLNINFVWLYLYLTQAPEGHVSRVWFDDVVIATDYIGPLRGKSENDK